MNIFSRTPGVCAVMLTTVILTLFTSRLYGQRAVTYEKPREDGNTPLNFNSPTAYAFAEYVTNPVGYYTGIPQISIPIYTIQLKDFALPVSLDYHAGGIKVEETASNVGLGWNLNAGGVITRSIKDKADDTSIEFCDTKWILSSGVSRPEIANFNECGNGLLWALNEPPTANYDGLGSYNVDLNAYNGLPNTPQYSLKLIRKFYATTEKVYTDYKDLYILPMADKEPDIFYFNFAGRTGQFLFDMSSGTAQIKTYPYQDLLIEYTTDAKKKLNSFKITDEKGVAYTFAAVEMSENRYGVNNNLQDKDDVIEGGMPLDYHVKNFETGTGITKYNSSWFLTRIDTPLGEYLDLVYEDETYAISSRGPQQTALYFLKGDPLAYSPNNFNPDPTFTTNWKKGYISLLAYNDLFVSGKRLYKIENDNIKIQFDAPNQRQDIALGYLGTPTGAHAISEITITNKIGGENRIKKVKLTQDYFLSNTSEYINKPDGLFGNRHDIVVPDSARAYKRLWLKSVQEFGKDDNAFDPPYVFTYKYSAYTGKSTDKLPHRFSFQQDFWGYYNNAYDNNTLIPFQYVYPDKYPVKDNRQYSIYKKGNSGREFFLSGADRKPNEFYADVCMLTKITYPTQGSTEYEYNLHNFRHEGQDNSGGGLRIATIKKKDGLKHSPEMWYQYGYSNEDNSNSSGCLVTMPIFAARIFGVLFGNSDGTSETAYNLYTVRYSTPQTSLNSTNGSYVGYRTVTEDLLGGGRTVYTFSMPAAWHIENDIPIADGGACDPAVDGHCDGLYNLTPVKDIFIGSTQQTISASSYNLTQNPAAPNTFPFPDNPNYDWQRGHLLSEKQYSTTLDESGITVPGALLKETSYRYGNYFPDNRTAPTKIYGYRFVNHYPLLNGTAFPTPADAYVFRAAKYTLLTDVAKVLTSRKEVIYNTADHAKKLTTELTFNYGNTRYSDATLITSTDSEGRTLETVLKFPGDFTANELGSNLLMPKHIHSIPLRQLTRVSGAVTTKKEVSYFASGGKVVPETVTSFLNGDASPDKAVLAYDDACNLQQSTPQYAETTDGTVKFFGNPTAYLWGYNKTLPIAKIENAKITDVFYTGFEDAEGNSAMNDSRTGHKSRSGGYVKSLSGLSNGGYVLTYWKKTESGWALQLFAVTVSQGSYSISIPNTDQVDDIRFYPAAALISSYTYDPLVGMTSVTDPNNLTTYFDFDAMNRLKFARDHDKKITTQHGYHFKAQP
jgi:hypothetical protein